MCLAFFFTCNTGLHFCLHTEEKIQRITTDWKPKNLSKIAARDYCYLVL